MMMHHQNESGFTAIELLITLFVAAAFLVAGYQLFNVVVKDGGQARAESKAGNVAYDYLRRYAPLATDPCATSTVLYNSPITVDGLSNVTITLVISCPNTSAPALSKIEATINYNTPQETVKFATFTNGSSTAPLDVTAGLVGWWRFNGNTTDSSGLGNNGTGTNLVATTGQNGVSNNAYTFNGTTSYMTAGNLAAFNSPEITLSTWVKPATASGIQTFIVKEMNYKMRWAGSNTFTTLVSANGSSWASMPTFSSTSYIAGNWVHVATTISSSANQIKFYVNGVQTGSTAAIGASITSYNSNPLLFGATTTGGSEPFNGAMDDARIYNRALSASEIQTVYAGGAK